MIIYTLVIRFLRTVMEEQFLGVMTSEDVLETACYFPRERPC